MTKLVLALCLFVLGTLPAQAQFFDPPAERIRAGNGAPASGGCDAAAEVNKVYIDNNQQDSYSPLYVCTKTGASTYAWVKSSASSASGGGGGAACVPKTPASTVTYDASAATAGSNICFTVTLNGTAISTNTITWPSSGTNQHLLFIVAQDATGGRAWPCPTGVSGCNVIWDTTANAVLTVEVAVTGSSAGQVISINGQSVTQTCKYFFEASSNGNNYQSACAPASLGGDTVATWPGVAGTIGVISGSTPTDGDCAKYSVSGGLVSFVTHGSACGGGSGFNPLAFTNLYGYDNFCQTSIAAIASNTIQSILLWGTSNTSGTATVVPAASSICGIKMGTPATTNSKTSLFFLTLNSATPFQLNPTSEANWQVTGVFSGVSASNSNEYIMQLVDPASSGSVCDSINYSGHCVGIVYRNGTDTNLMGITCEAFACSTVDTGVAFSAGSKHKVWIRATTAATIRFCGNVNAAGTCAVSEVTLAAHIPNQVLATTFNVFAGSNNAASQTVHYFAYSLTSGY